MPEEKKAISPGLQVAEDLGKVEAQVLSDKQSQNLAFYKKKLNDARDAKNLPRTEFDDLSFEVDYELNKRSVNTYLRKKLNDNEVRIATTATEKRVEVIQNELAALNFQSEIMAFDKNDNEIRSLGYNMSDIVDRTNKMEDDDDMWREFIREMLTQRAVFTEEIDEYIVVNGSKPTKMGTRPTIYQRSNKKVVLHRAKKRLLSGLQVYLGNIFLPAYKFHEQPFIVKYYRKSYDEGAVIYQEWDNWKHVKAGQITEDNPFSYRMNTLESDEIEEIHYIDPHKNEYMIIINGVMMFDEPVSCPWEITEKRKYNMTMTVLKSMGMDFAYGKPVTASSKTLQGLSDETFRLLVEKFRQAIRPPIAVKSKKVYSKEIWNAGSIVQGTKAGDFELLNPNNQGVTSSEFNMAGFIDSMIEESTGVPKQAQGLTGDNKSGTTATEILNQQRQFAKMLGQAMISLMAAKRNTTLQRIYNIIENFTDVVERKYDPTTDMVRDIFQKFTITNGISNDGKRVKKIIQFLDRNLSDEEQEDIFEFEQKEEDAGRPTRVEVINRNVLREIPTLWHIVVNQKERDGGALEKAMFTDKITQAASIQELTGRRINADTVINDYETTWKVERMFQEENQQQQGQQSPEQEQLSGAIADVEGQTQLGDQLKEGQVAGQTNTPSINTLGQQ